MGRESRPRSNIVIQWLIQNTAAHPSLADAEAPPGMLSAEETAVFAGFKVFKRRQDWLLGRWTAKHLLQEMIFQKSGQRAALDRISILPGADGAPLARFEAAAGVQASSFAVSISHSHGSSFCAAVARPEWPIGADMELIESRPANFAADFFTVEEQKQVEQTAPALHDALVTAVWSAKEAALKATHEGLRVDTRSVYCEIEAPSVLPRTWRPFPIQWRRNSGTGPYPDLKGWWMIRGHYALTLVIGNDQEIGEISGDEPRPAKRS